MAVLARGDRRPSDSGSPGDVADAAPPSPADPHDATARPRTGNAVPSPSVAAMFDEIAPVYDRLNTVMTFGRDRAWRTAAADAADLLPGGAAIDVAAGTGKLAAVLADRVGPFGRVLAVDLSGGMIERARADLPDLVQLEFRLADALDLSAPDGEFDAATIAFGLRNLADFEAGLRELRRVVRPGGRVVCLELTIPRPAIWGAAFRAVFGILVPLVGLLVGRSRRYGYLPASLRGFPDAEALAATMRGAGLVDVTVRRFALGSVALHVGTVPADSG
ncbi:MAG TPA: ubiquinone/menaquinone biosynthesis methyltransferase [Vitreimonas sp.]|nr:ubiquinone/menaquinone biosynthesis methyltransferase [Vitreimonas sp.]